MAIPRCSECGVRAIPASSRDGLCNGCRPKQPAQKLYEHDDSVWKEAVKPKKLKIEPPKRVRTTKAPSDRKPGGQPGPRAGNPEEEVRLYVEEGMTPRDIAVKIGIAYETVLNHLKRAGVFDPTRHRTGGIRRTDLCHRGHDLTVPENTRQLYKNGVNGRIKAGRECLLCKRERDKEHWANNRAQLTKGPRAKGQPKSGDLSEEVRLYVNEDLPPWKIAEIVGIAEQTVKNHLKFIGVYDPKKNGRWFGHEKRTNG